MEKKLNKINEVFTTKRLTRISEIWKEVYSEKDHIVHITELFEEKARKEKFTSEEIDLFLRI